MHRRAQRDVAVLLWARRSSLSLFAREFRLVRVEHLALVAMLAYLPGLLFLPTWVPLVLAALAGLVTAAELGSVRERLEVRAATDLPPSAQAGTRPARRALLLPPAHPDLRGSSPSG